MKALPVMLSAALTLSATALAARQDTRRDFAAAGVMALSVRVAFHDVTVRVARGASVRVDVRTEAQGVNAQGFVRAQHPTVNLRGGTVSVEALPSVGRPFTRSTGAVLVTLPPGKTIEVQTASGDCTLTGLETGAAARCTTASGDVRVDSPAPELQIETASGDVTARGAVRASVRTASGDVTLSALGGALDVTTASGDVRAAWQSLPPGSAVRVQVASGDVALRLPSGAGPGGLLETASGDIEAAFPGTAERRVAGSRLTLSGDGARVNVTAASGDIEVGKN